MVYPRQRLYDINHTGFAKAVLLGSINTDGEDESTVCGALKQAFFEYTGVDDVIPLSRGRLAVYFGVKHSITPKRRKVLMSPFTIFDVVNMVLVAGGEPNFVDTEPGSVHVSCRSLEEAIDGNTGAVIVTHYHSTNREIESIAAMCRAYGVKLIEDCAISLGGRFGGRHVGTFGDCALFSFGLFKFVSAYFGGGMWLRCPETRAAVEAEIATWPRMCARDIAPQFLKGIKLSTLTNTTVFDLLTFPVFRYGYLRNVEFIKKNAQNDPDPFVRKSLALELMRRPSLFQLREVVRQIPLVEGDRRKRVSNACRYYENLIGTNIGGLPDRPDRSMDCYLNFPITLDGNREWFVAELMKSGFDVSVYYYRNCAEISAFRKYCKYLPNVSRLVRGIVFFPAYPRVTPAYIDRLTTRVEELICLSGRRRG